MIKSEIYENNTSRSLLEHRTIIFNDKNFGNVRFLSYSPTKMDLITEIGTIKYLDGEVWIEAKSTL